MRGGRHPRSPAESQESKQTGVIALSFWFGVCLAFICRHICRDGGGVVGVCLPSFPLKGHLAFCHCYGCIGIYILSASRKHYSKRKRNPHSAPFCCGITQPIYSADKGVLICGRWVCLRKPGLSFVCLVWVVVCFFLLLVKEGFQPPTSPRFPTPISGGGVAPYRFFFFFLVRELLLTVFFPTSQVTRKSVAGYSLSLNLFLLPLAPGTYYFFPPKDEYI